MSDAGIDWQRQAKLNPIYLSQVLQMIHTLASLRIEIPQSRGEFKKEKAETVKMRTTVAGIDMRS